MNRYFYYSILMCMLMNTIIYVPTILIAHRREGAMLGFGLTIVVGSLLSWMFSKAMMTFKSRGLPEIVLAHLHPAFGVPLLLYVGSMFFAAGTVVLVSYSGIISRSMGTTSQPEVFLILFLITVCWWASRSTKTILYLLEIIMLINVPLAAVIFIKAVTSEYMNWYAVWETATENALKLPKMEFIAAASYLFTGYINMGILNREFRQFRPKLLWAIPFLGLGVLCTTVFIPVGFHGTAGAEHYVTVWVSTSDSMQMELGFVERVIYLYLMLFLSLSLLFASVVWHVGYEIIQGALPGKWVVNSIQLKPVLIFGLFAAVTYGYLTLFNEKQTLSLATAWLSIRFWSELAFVVLVYYLSRKGTNLT
ncbi:hypothetical protein ABEX47_24695 [Paenibacillus ehimensis]|uniref:hypothetical protein n=1 Tax=Paenibacillus ehimensis TaxID=79264 RepID=UPI0004708F56|nr:hypothetical protein [Paenibacillus ehimensis]